MGEAATAGFSSLTAVSSTAAAPLSVLLTAAVGAAGRVLPNEGLENRSTKNKIKRIKKYGQKMKESKKKIIIIKKRGALECETLKLHTFRFECR